MSTRRSPLNVVVVQPATKIADRRRSLPLHRRIRGVGAIAAGLGLLAMAPGTAAFADPTPTIPGDTTTTTTTSIPLPSDSTTTSTSTSTTTSTTAPSSTTTTQPKKGSVPKVPVGSPTTTTPKNAPPTAPPNPAPILSAVDEDLDQLQAIADYKPAQAMVAAAQQQVTQASAAVQSARFVLQRAQQDQLAAGKAKEYSDAKLRDIALAAYIGVGYSTPGFGGPGGNGDEGFGTVSTPGGLTGVESLDAQELLQIVGERAVQFHDEATETLNTAVRSTTSARVGVQKAEGVAAAAETNLLNAQQTLKLVTAAAVVPGTAAATQLPVLASDIGGPLPPSATTTTPAAPATTTSPVISQTTATTTNASANLVAASQQNAPTVIANPPSPTILGTAVLSPDELAAWYDSTGRKANTTVPIAQLAQFYQAWGSKTGVRDDLAFAQSIVETGFFGFPAGGQLTGANNNFAGIGACDSCAHGWSFPSADNGVGAQMQLLDAYASSKKVDTSLVGSVGVGGCCTTWTDLAGTWASSLTYGISIMTIYDQMLKWVMPERMLSAGLLGPTQTSADQGPELAPLPPGPSQPKPAGPANTAPHH